ncbi:hypothetical protein [Chitinophaga sancti]|uniref:Uncharacterized protein n=1 Tax=Chitinophaga sancti TaxID=1004 RepID=A0A1K1SZA7_9BACT|nr:hypothetical protein [Chitinophaga sancti]WQD63643.1 hypothetical protein U0033_04490 [Chitinophaga sancti]WQG90732.1 hypothetical protein SR876_04430 [Chitinophaga sancti]SFW89635.1 hypothetical protein SAMN05661012_06463 [Chitinophaga sancti]
MKKILFFSVVSCFLTAGAKAQVIIVRPVHRVVVVARPVPPPPPPPPVRVVVVRPRPCVRVYARL